MSWLRHLGIGVALLVAGPAAAAAQAPGLTLGPLISGVRAQGPALAAPFSGTMGGAEGRLIFGPVQLGIRYQEGVAHSDDGRTRNLVEGELHAGVWLRDWLLLSAGPHARTFLLDEDRLRRVQLQAHVRFAVPIVPGVSWALLNLWAAPVAGSNNVGGLRDSHGGEGGMLFVMPRTPVRLRLTYRVDSGIVGTASSREAVEQISLSAAIGFGPQRP